MQCARIDFFSFICGIHYLPTCSKRIKIILKKWFIMSNTVYIELIAIYNFAIKKKKKNEF